MKRFFYILCIALGMAGIILLILIRKLPSSKTIFYPPAIPTPSDSLFTILMLGYAGGNHDGAYLTDTILVGQINMTRKTVALISIPRDLWVKIPGDENTFTKINSLYEQDRFRPSNTIHSVFSDTQLIRNVIRDITNISTDRVILVNFEGFEKTIDILGGVDVRVDTSFEDKEYPVTGKETDTCTMEGQALEDALELATMSALEAFPCRYETVKFDAGVVHMDGATALKYSRSRHGNGEEGDFSRAKRQQYILEAMKEKLLLPSSVPHLNSLFNTLKVHILTDLSPSDLIQFIREIPNIKQYTVYSLALDLDNVLKYDYSPDGQYILIPKEGMDKWDQTKQFIKNSTLPSLSSIATPSVILKN